MKPQAAESIAYAMEADARLLPILPDLLVDLEDLGPAPKQVVSLFKALRLKRESLVLDLGCGKGAVAVALTGHLGLRVEGIDVFPPFLRAARALRRV